MFKRAVLVDVFRTLGCWLPKYNTIYIRKYSPADINFGDYNNVWVGSATMLNYTDRSDVSTFEFTLLRRV